MKKDLPDTPLMAALDLCRRVIERRNTIPILDNILVSANKGTLELTGTDLDVEITIPLDIGGEASFQTTLPSEILHRICAFHGNLDFAPLSASHLSVEAGGYIYQLSTLPAADFPRLKCWSPQVSFEMNGADLLADLKAVRNGISTEETRYYLNGVFWHSAPANSASEMRFVATDGHRLYVVKRPLPAGVEGLPGLIIPRKVVGVLIAALERDCTGPVSIDMGAEGGGRIRFTAGDVMITAKTIDGTYPDYGRVIPTASPRGVLKCNASKLKAAAEAVGLIMSERTRAVSLNFGKGRPGEATVASMSPENGRFAAPMPGNTSGVLPESIGLNAAYLVDACDPFGDAVIMLGMEDAAAPVLITSESGEFARLTVVQMPMRL